jgi:hypothetical protein
MDAHGGERPTALELSLALRRTLELQSVGGWFGLLRARGLLTEQEKRALDVEPDFLLDVEYGSYNKSYKLVTLNVLLNMGAMRSKASLREIALGARWEIFRDPRLTADLADARTAFADVWNPTEAEWAAYWRKNPIHAFASGGGAKRTYFDFEDDQFTLSIDVPSADGEVFDGLVREMVEYRLHRYLVQRKAVDTGDARKPLDENGNELNATFRVLSIHDGGASIRIESGGGAKGSDSVRNPDYVKGLDAVLTRMAQLGLELVDAYVDSGKVQQLPVSDRRLDVSPLAYPMDLREVGEVAKLRAAMLRGSVKVGRAPGAKGGGNGRKALRLMVKGLEGEWPNAKLADALAGFGMIAVSDQEQA